MELYPRVHDLFWPAFFHHFVCECWQVSSCRRLPRVIVFPAPDDLQQHHAITVDITLFGNGVVGDPLGSQVPPRAPQRRIHKALLPTHQLCQTEIRDFGHKVIVKEDILRLHITVYYLELAFLMEISQPFRSP
ncbi:hypothetical protein MLD38_030668 [Melastoma candidum]|uniref:Uncharacterized protein n=1 Tax=Melastoma candidum TaxID=119954 RepID=A0ACB9MPG9_9MYRT|nr:hypothetical protein MLD38_030668 [Melastoma candidum]